MTTRIINKLEIVLYSAKFLALSALDYQFVNVNFWYFVLNGVRHMEFDQNQSSFS
jgi:hypothetical protein